VKLVKKLNDMPDDDRNIDFKELMSPVEVLNMVALGCIETLRRKQVCFYPGAHIPPQPDDIADFGQCLGLIGDCNALIFCDPHHDKAHARARIQFYMNGGDPALEFDHFESITDYDFIWQDALLFPTKADKLLIGWPNGEPEIMRPPDSQFWAHYVILKIVDRDEKLHVLHLGLGGQHAWGYFLMPYGIKVARMIENPVIV
jgi:hypothetical protein